MEIGTFLTLSLGIIYVGFTLWVRRKITKALYLSSKRRTLHLWFIWCVPFLGPLILRGFWKQREILKTRTIKDRNPKSDHFF